MQLIKRGSTEGLWYEYVEDAQPIAKPEDRSQREGAEPNACFKVRRIPTGLDRETAFRFLGRKQEVRRKEGAVISDFDLDKQQQYYVELAVYALVDSFDAELPVEFLKGTKPAADVMAGVEMLRLDGQWDETVKRAVFKELPNLAKWVCIRSFSQNSAAAEEEHGLGKTS